jgi:GH25 family lysozyme M1 (1,4-beta-N-acetylmuramidase)
MPVLIDLYQKYNAIADWPALSRAVSGAYVKFSDGTCAAAVHADDYVKSCHDNGIPFGGYHFAEPGDPIAQADCFVALYKKFRPLLAPALDLETGEIPLGQRKAFARAFLERVHQTYGTVVLYANSSWLCTLNPDAWPYPWDLTWCAEYGTNRGLRNAVRQYPGRVDLHQYTSRGHIGGAVSLVDLSWTDNLAPFLLQPSHTSRVAPAAARSTKEDDVSVNSHDYQPTGAADADGAVPERCHTFVVPVGSASAITGRAWLSFKCAVGAAKSVRLMAIGSNPVHYLVDRTFSPVSADASRPWIEAPDGADQFTAFVRSEYPYSLCIEVDSK